jgi:hypothetical protein
LRFLDALKVFSTFDAGATDFQAAAFAELHWKASSPASL